MGINPAFSLVIREDIPSRFFQAHSCFQEWGFNIYLGTNPEIPIIDYYPKLGEEST
jgi:hypothetical protein